DNYLNKKIIAMATATPNVHSASGVDRMNTDAYAIYTFGNSTDNVNDQFDNMAMGRSFIETVSAGGNGSTSTNPMILYFATKNDSIPMGRYPIIVDPSTQSVNLHVIIKNIPASPSKLNLVIKK